MARNRVVITGIGWVTPVGNDVPSGWANLLAGKSGIGTITHFDHSKHDVHFAGEVRNLDIAATIDSRDANRMDRFAILAMVAAIEAVRDSALDFDRCDRSRVGVILGSGIGGLIELEDQHFRMFQRGPGRVSPFFIPKLMMNAAPGHISMRFGLHGPNFSTASACSSSNHAMGTALRLIQHGEADVVLTGGSEATVNASGVAAFSALKALSTRNDDPTGASRPFDKERDGFVLSEGGAILVFESRDHALARGARIHAEVLGFGMTGDAHHLTAPDPSAEHCAASMRNAVKDAGLTPEQIAYVNAHGTSTPLNDAIETRAIHKVFGAHARKMVVNSTKSMVGHTLGAAGAIELIATVLSVKEDVVHPTINHKTPDPECDLDYVPNEARRVSVPYALSNSLGFGGHNTSIVVGKA